MLSQVRNRKQNTGKWSEKAAVLGRKLERSANPLGSYPLGTLDIEGHLCAVASYRGRRGIFRFRDAKKPELVVAGLNLVGMAFDLQQNLSIDIRPQEIVVQLPHAQILGVEQEQLDVLAFENGLWNRISGQDLQSQLSILPQLASKKAAESGLPAEAERTLQRQLGERIHPSQPLHLVFKDGKKRE